MFACWLFCVFFGKAGGAAGFGTGPACLRLKDYEKLRAIPDSLDRAIIAELQTDACQSTQAIANSAGALAVMVVEQVKALSGLVDERIMSVKDVCRTYARLVIRTLQFDHKLCKVPGNSQ